MLFNSIDFIVFLPIVFLLYWVFAKHFKFQNFIIVIVSYIFYGWWDWRFLFLIFFSTIIDFFVGLELARQKEQKRRELLLLTSLFVNLSILGFFKYFNFFIDSFVSAFSFFGIRFEPYHLNVILPVGISFYTFQTMSYSIDIYKKQLSPTRDFIAFSGFVSFFPQLVAGPIERATKLLPQFLSPRVFDYEKALDGCKQILWGFFKKIVVADNCAVYANMFFNNYHEYSGSSLVLGVLFFSFQIYGDFSGYSDIAVGTARLFGIDLMRNFSYPYFSRDIAEFWRKWHISLNTWFRDYVYIPLGGSRYSKLITIRNTFTIFLLCGLWHGANWTFVFWGLLNAIYFIPLLLLNKNRMNLGNITEGKILPTSGDILSIVSTFILTAFAWIFFRAENINHAFRYISRIFSSSFFSVPQFDGKRRALLTVIMIFFLLIVEWIQRNKQHGLQMSHRIPAFFRWLILYGIIFIMLLYGGSQQSFIYFQF
jgi:D-alanyl-lipoteichoic acid acyltransferase DltB (MBOAT superfamily)